MKVNEVLKSQLLHCKPMKARFRLPMNSELASQYLIAAISAEVEYRNHPFRNGNLCVLKDCPNKTREVSFTMRTAESSVFAFMTMVLSAIRAYNIL